MGWTVTEPKKKRKQRRRFRWLAWLASVLWVLPEYFLLFVLQWWATRRWVSLVLGVPAIASAIVFLMIPFFHSRTLPAQRIRQLDLEGRMALQDDDLQAAHVAFRRIAFLDSQSHASSFGLALTAERQGDLDSARVWMRRIASDSQPGHPPAHFWLAADLMRQETALTLDQARVLEHHLLQAARDAAYEAESRVQLTRLYLLRGENDRAISQIERVASQRPALLLDLARLQAQAGRKPEARRAATQAGEFFRARAQAEPDQPIHRQAWANSLVLQERYEDAVRVLAEGLSSADPEPFQKALSAVYLQWLSATSDPKKPDPVRQLEFLERILQFDASNERALAILGSLAVGDDEPAEQAVQMLTEMLARGAAPGAIHLALGTRAITRGDVDRGVLHLEQAQQRNPRTPEVMNNLAWGLAHRDPPDLERALRLAESAEQMSDHPEIHDTLGTILAKMGRTREAITQLETALRKLPPRASIHRALSDLYQELGNQPLADEHTKLADQLESSIAASDRP